MHSHFAKVGGYNVGLADEGNLGGGQGSGAGPPRSQTSIHTQASEALGAARQAQRPALETATGGSGDPLLAISAPSEDISYDKSSRDRKVLFLGNHRLRLHSSRHGIYRGCVKRHHTDAEDNFASPVRSEFGLRSEGPMMVASVVAVVFVWNARFAEGGSRASCSLREPGFELSSSPAAPSSVSKVRFGEALETVVTIIERRQEIYVVLEGNGGGWVEERGGAEVHVCGIQIST
ncbi:hypothetical protein EDB84DRAFT_1621467 [Lactarius hengduanensis]|nr:hypothetical protein EDB84DRAFT_1621467 [Lactarius hengduanensis]